MIRHALLLAVLAGPAPAQDLATRLEPSGAGVPDAPVVDQFGGLTTLHAALGDGAFVLGFTYTDCASVCGTADLWISDLAARKGELGLSAKVVTLSLDPARDTPAALLARYRDFGSPEGWILLTGRTEDILPVLLRLGARDRGPLEEHEILVLVGNGRSGQVSPLRASPTLPDDMARLAAAYAR